MKEKKIQKTKANKDNFNVLYSIYGIYFILDHHSIAIY